MLSKLRPDARAALIGSLPVRDHREATDIVSRYTPDIPLWVQLPFYKKEGLLRQFISGVPGLVMVEDRVLVNTSLPVFENSLLGFWEEYVAVTDGTKPLDESRFVLAQDEAPGFFVFLEAFKKASSPFAIKGQISGPVTLCLGISNQDKQALFYDDRLRDALTKTIALKARWQVEQLKLCGAPVILFIDEPGLAGFGSSAVIGVSKEEVQKLINEVIDQIHAAGGLAGVHVCGNTDWSILLDSPADIVSFDAYEYFERFILYAKDLKSFLEKEKILSWGIVPTLKEEYID
ncbi:MAG: hypothetical protein V1753_11375, partial [Pseudomonadota bacterium]